MREYEATTTIRGAADRVWAVLIDVSAYPEWDPFCDRIEGRAALGERLKVYSKLSPGRAFPVKVTGFERPERMVWSGGMPLGLFKGVRTFSLIPIETEVTTFGLREVFSGPLLKLIGGSIPDMTDAFSAFASGLKARVEAVS